MDKNIMQIPTEFQIKGLVWCLFLVVDNVVFHFDKVLIKF